VNGITFEDINDFMKRLSDAPPPKPLYMLSRESYDILLKKFPEIVLLNSVIISEYIPADIDGVIYNG
jgi:hypothetical protein